MKRFAFLLVLISALLTACPIIDTSPRVSVSPASPLLDAGESIDLSACANFQLGESTFSWSATEGVLSADSGAKVTYTPPNKAGTYTVTVSSSFESKAGRALVTIVDEVTANQGTHALRSTPISLNRSDIYKVNIPEGLSADLVYFELATNDDLRLTLYDDNKNTLAKSKSSRYFYASDSVFTTSIPQGTEVQTVEAQAIQAKSTCRGPCILTRNSLDTYYLKVTARSSGNYKLYIYGAAFQDEAEPDDCETPQYKNPTFKTAAINIRVEGAIETLGDKDCVSASGVKQLELSMPASTAISIYADVYLNGRRVERMRVEPDDDPALLSFTRETDLNLVIRSNQAGPANSSSYILKID